MRKLSLLLLACLTLGIAWAERVSVNTAQQVAANVAAGLSPSNLRSSSDLTLVYAAPAQQQSGLRAAGNESDYYIFNVGTGDGFIIVAGEDRVRPVLGYSAEGEVDMEKMPGNMKAWLEMYQKEISWAVAQNISASGEIQGEWQGLLNGSTQLRAGEPQLQTAHWAQGEPFNRMTPMIGGEHAVTGCVATAQAIVMYYYKQPEKPIVNSTNNSYTITEYKAIDQGNGWYKLEVESEKEYQEQLQYDGYDWDNMLPSYNDGYSDAQANAIAELMRDCGYNVNMDYAKTTYPDGRTSLSSGASTSAVVTSLKNVFGYSQSVQYVEKQAYRWADWIALIKKEIDEKRPVILNGTDPMQGGHAFVCDGYSSENYFSINWGWGRTEPEYYLLSALDDDGESSGFAAENYGAIIGIQPDGGVPAEPKPFVTEMVYEGSFPLPTDVSMGVAWRYSGVKAISFWDALAVVDEAGIIQEPTPNTHHSWNLSETSGWYVNYNTDINDNIIYTNYEISLSSPLQEGERIAFVYSTDEGNTWQVMPVAAEAPLGLNNEGLIEQGPDDPNVPVEPEDITASLGFNSFNDRYSYPVLGQDPTGARIEIKVNKKTDLIFRYTVSDYQAWIGNIDIQYEPEFKQGPLTDFDFSQNGIVEIPSENCGLENNEDGSINYVTVFSIMPQISGALNFKIEVLDKTGETCYATFENIGTRFVKAPVEMIFNPDAQQIEGNINTDIPFTLTLKNLDDFFVGKDVSLDFLTGKYNLGDFTLTYQPTDGEPQSVLWEYNDVGSLEGNLTIHNAQNDVPYRFVLNSKVEMNPEEEQFNDYISFWLSYEDIEILLTRDYGIWPSITAMNIVDVYGEEDYVAEHEDATVIVHSEGVYTVNTTDASINSLTIEDGGQVKLQQPLTVTNEIEVQRNVPTDKWTTFGAPIYFKFRGEDGADLFANGTYEARTGYLRADEQYWYDFSSSEVQTGMRFLIANAASPATAVFRSEYYKLNPPVSKDANMQDATWFLFDYNPNWENLQLQGHAYVLDETGLNFALRENPTIKPFEAYMVASDEVMANVSNLRIGDIPTSNEDLAVTGFRVWTESGHVCFETTEAKDVAVYSMNGVQQCRFERSVGVHRQQLPQGIYIVVCDGTAYKVSVK